MITDTITTQVKNLLADAKALPGTLRSIDLAELPKQAQGLAQTAATVATGVCSDLLKRGSDLVSGLGQTKSDEADVADIVAQAGGVSDAEDPAAANDSSVDDVATLVDPVQPDEDA